eukprot:Ihof_evm4s313 gene=Ihof_evmTU4s313
MTMSAPVGLEVCRPGLAGLWPLSLGLGTSYSRHPQFGGRRLSWASQVQPAQRKSAQLLILGHTYTSPVKREGISQSRWPIKQFDQLFHLSDLSKYSYTNMKQWYPRLIRVDDVQLRNMKGRKIWKFYSLIPPLYNMKSIFQPVVAGMLQFFKPRTPLSEVHNQEDTYVDHGGDDWSTAGGRPNRTDMSMEERKRRNQENLSWVYLQLQEDLPDFFVREQDYTIYNGDIRFEEDVTRLHIKFNGIRLYRTMINSIRWTSYLCFSDIKLSIMSITKHQDEMEIRVRWQAAATRWSAKLYLDAFSVFKVDGRGTIVEH